MGYKIMIYEKRASLFRDALLGTNPNFNTNAPPFEVRGVQILLVQLCFKSKQVHLL